MRTIPRAAPAAAVSPVATPQSTGRSAGPASTSAASSVVVPWRAAAILDDPVTASVLYSAWSGDPAVVVPSPPGAGKTRLVALLAATLAERADLRVGIAAQTRDQAVEIARRCGVLTNISRLIWPAKGTRPDVPGVVAVQGQQVRFPATGGGVLIATTARWLYTDPGRLGCDVMLVDEAWQCTFADLGALGAFADQIVCVGDPGQIDPVVTGQTRRWASSDTGPHLSAPAALVAAHGDAVSQVRLRHTWRLGPQTTALIQPTFYPRLPFASRRPPERLVAAGGGDLPEVAHHDLAANAGPSDPALTAACADLGRAMIGRCLVTSEGSRAVEQGDVAVVCTHVTQAAAVRALLADLPEILVGTANQLQGMERPAVVALHPLAGYRELAGFGTDLGRACVMLSRHRAHLTVVIDRATPRLLDKDEGADPTAGTHRLLLDALLSTPSA